MNKKQVITNYLRETTSENLIQVLSLPLSNKELQLELGDLRINATQFEQGGKHTQFYDYLLQNQERIDCLNIGDFSIVFECNQGYNISRWEPLVKRQLELLYSYFYESLDSEHWLHALDTLTHTYRASLQGMSKKGLLPRHINYFKGKVHQDEYKAILIKVYRTTAFLWVTSTYLKDDESKIYHDLKYLLGYSKEDE